MSVNDDDEDDSRCDFVVKTRTFIFLSIINY